MTRAIALVDLDDTLFQTIGKTPPDIPHDALVPLGFAKDGAPLSYATPRQMRFVEWLGETTHLVPVTARSLDALRRVRIPFAGAICAHGGVVLDDRGRFDPVWAARIAREAATYGPMLDRLAAAIADRGDPAIRVRVLTEGTVPMYVLAKHADGDGAALSRVVDAAVPGLPEGWTDHRNGNNVALMPPFLGKAQAVAHILPALRRRWPEATVIGIGDSLTDAPFMRHCDFAMLPTRSQLGTRLWDAEA